MLGNVAIDLLVGAVPFFGDAADVFWKSNTKNFTLLEHHARAAAAVQGDWLFVDGLLALLLLVAIVRSSWCTGSSIAVAVRLLK